MGPKSLQFLALFVCLLYMQTIGFSLVSGDSKMRCKDRERRGLLKFKQDLVDTSDLLSSWVSEEDCCQWKGVGCSNKTGHVVMLDLRATYQIDSYGFPSVVGLGGEISSSLLELRHLNYLDLSWNSFARIPIPGYIGSLGRLRYLNLSYAGFAETIPHQLGNLSRLRSLDLNSTLNYLNVDNLDWLSRLSSLRYLDMSGVDLSKVVNWLQIINLIPSLLELRLVHCQLLEPPTSLPYVNFTSLTILDLSQNQINSSIPSWLFNTSTSLLHLDLSDNQFHDQIPDAFGNMISLQFLDLFNNDLEGVIPTTLGNLCNLQTLDLSLNDLTGDMFGFLGNSSGCIVDSLESLSLRKNHFNGYLPDDLGRFSSLTKLSLSNNPLNGPLPESIGLLSELVFLDVSSNSLEGVVSEAHFFNLSQLQHLDLSLNSLVLNLNDDWVPPFQLDFIQMRSCQLGQFPGWLQTQDKFSFLDISNARISDTIPDWFKDLSPNIKYLNLSRNHLEGSLSPFSSNVKTLDLSKNKFSGSIVPSLCETRGSDNSLEFLDLSENLLSGGLPDCWMYWKNLRIFLLANNNLSGEIPSSMGSLVQLTSLNLRNNNFSGELPLSLKNCTNLIFVDLGENKLVGNIQPWIGEALPSLKFLILRSNDFDGKIPRQLCHLTNLKILDLAQNHISGTIPRCLSNITTMTKEDSYDNSYDDYGGDGWNYIENALVTWKGRVSKYDKYLKLFKSIDLSSNNLSGKIPEEVADLFGLVSLNLSRNHLIGTIPKDIGHLQNLESLDFSRNRLSGVIPSSLSNISFLSILDLSNNELSGSIPSGTQLQGFDESVYIGNSELCGLPLPVKCPSSVKYPGNETSQVPSLGGDGDGSETLWRFYFSVGLGFVVGFLGLCGVLLFKHSWRYAYFRCLNNIQDRLFVIVAVNVVKLKKKFQSNEAHQDAEDLDAVDAEGPRGLT